MREERSGFGERLHVAVRDEHQNPGSFIDATDREVAQLPRVAERDLAVTVDGAPW